MPTNRPSLGANIAYGLTGGLLGRNRHQWDMMEQETDNMDRRTRNALAAQRESSALEAQAQDARDAEFIARAMGLSPEDAAKTLAAMKISAAQARTAKDNVDTKVAQGRLPTAEKEGSSQSQAIITENQANTARKRAEEQGDKNTLAYRQGVGVNPGMLASTGSLDALRDKTNAETGVTAAVENQQQVSADSREKQATRDARSPNIPGIAASKAVVESSRAAQEADQAAREAMQEKLIIASFTGLPAPERLRRGRESLDAKHAQGVTINGANVPANAATAYNNGLQGNPTPPWVNPYIAYRDALGGEVLAPKYGGSITNAPTATFNYQDPTGARQRMNNIIVPRNLNGRPFNQ